MPDPSHGDTETVDPQVSTSEQPVTPQIDPSDDKSASSTEDGAKSMLEAVQSALKPKDATPASQTPEKDDKSEPGPDKASEDDEPPEEERRNWSEKTQKRFQKLVGDAKAARQQVEDLRPKADEYDKLDAFIKNAGLQPPTVQAAMQFAYALQHDPVAAYQRALAIAQYLSPTVGETLPPDLRQRVEQGYLTEEDARKLSRASADATLSRQRLENSQRAAQEANQTAVIRQQADASQSAIETWEKTRGSDPDWHLKQAEVAEQVELAFERKRRETGNPQWFPQADEAVKMADEALKTVNTRLKRFAPKPTEIRPTATDSGASNRAQPEPKTMFDAIKQAVARGR